MLVLSRRLEGRTSRLLPVVAGTVFSQTLINLLALVILLAVTFTSVPLPSGHVAAIATALALPLARVRAGARRPAPAGAGTALALAAGRAGGEHGQPHAAARAAGPASCSRRPRYGVHRDRLPAARVGAAVARLLHGDPRARAPVAGGPGGGRGDPAGGQPQRDPAGDAVERRRLPGRLPGGARRLRRRRRAGARLRHHPAGGRGGDRAGARRAGAAQGGPVLAGHPPQRRRRS